MKITEDKKLEIIEMYKRGLTLAEISRITGITAYPTVSKYVKLAGLTVKQLVPAKKYYMDESIFESINDEKSAYWLGFLMADGYVAQGRRSKDRKLKSKIALVLAIKDSDHIELYKQDLKTNYPVINKKRRSSLEIYNKKVCSDLINQGCVQAKSLILRYPKIDNSLDHHFIRGYFDGDGSVFVNNKGYLVANIASGSMEFLNSVILILNSKGIKTNKVCHHKQEKCNHVCIASDSLTEFYSFLYNQSHRYMQRKKRRFEEALGMLQSLNSVEKTKNGI